MRRRVPERLGPADMKFYLFCEGEKTEPYYFGGFQRAISDNPVYCHSGIVTILPKAGGANHILQTAKRYVEDHHLTAGQIWCVYDKDETAPDVFDAAARQAVKLNKSLPYPDLRYHMAWSNECFEFWFVLHFADYRANNSRKSYKALLDARFQSAPGRPEYRKTLPDLYDVLLRQGRPDLAIQRARRMETEVTGRSPSQIAPGTHVYALVEALLPYLSEEERRRFTGENG